MSDQEHLRWAVNCREWNISETELLMCLHSIQPEECTRIGRFRFRRDALLALTGRLLLRKAVSIAFNMPWHEVKFGRTPRNKPIVLNPPDSLTKSRTAQVNSRNVSNKQSENSILDWNVNVSHHGMYAVLAAETGRLCGVDVMSLDAQPNTDEFFELMTPQCSPNEWAEIKAADNPLEHFYRIWTLKESYIKATGEGLHFDLQKVVFAQDGMCAYSDWGVGVVDTGTQFILEGKARPDWIFEQSYLDSNHCIAVGLGPLTDADGNENSKASIQRMNRKENEKHVFQHISPDTLLDSLETVHESVTLQYARDILSKPWSAHED